MKRVAAICYLLCGLVSAFVCFQSLMWAVWGAPTHWVQYVALLSSLALAIGAIGLLGSAESGQRICVLSVLGMGSFYVPAVESIIPAENTIVSPLNYLILAAYLVLVVATTSYPKRVAGAYWIIALVCGTMSLWAGSTAYSRWYSGEYNRPEVIGFLANRSEAPITASKEHSALFPSTVCSEIAKAGIGGSLEWRAGSVENKQKPVVVIIATSQIKESHRLYYPKQGTIIYLWNGERWMMLPSDADLYPAYSTLQVDGMLSTELTTGGTQSYLFFPWSTPQNSR